MSKPAPKEIPPDPFLEELDALQAGLNRLRDKYVQGKILRSLELASPASGGYLTAKEIAERTGHRQQSILSGYSGFACLNEGRIKDGGAVRYPAQLFEIHQRNRHSRGKCGTCAEEFRGGKKG